MAKIGFIEVDITADISHIRAGLASASSLIRDFSLLSIGLTSGINNAFRKISTIGIRAFQIGLIGITGTLVGATMEGSKFEDAMKRVFIMVGKGAEVAAKDVIKLTERAEELGRETLFSATEAAEGMVILGRAGFDVGQIFDAVTPILELAIATNMDMATTADMVVASLYGFGLAVSEAGRMADVMATIVTGSNETMEDLANTLSYIAPIASTVGMSVEETGAAIMMLANAGVRGSKAATGLRAAIAKMLSPTKAEKKLLEELGVSFLTAEGELKDFDIILTELGKSTISTAHIFQLFGRRAATAISVLRRMGPSTFRKFTGELASSQGATERMAEEMRKTFIGRVRDLVASIKLLGTTIYNSYRKPLTDTIFELRNMVVAITSALKKNKTFENIVKGVRKILNLFGITIKGVTDEIVKFIESLTPEKIDEFFGRAVEKVIDLKSKISEFLIPAIEGIGEAIESAGRTIKMVFEPLLKLWLSLSDSAKEFTAKVIAVGAAFLWLVGGLTPIILLFITLSSVISSLIHVHIAAAITKSLVYIKVLGALKIAAMGVAWVLGTIGAAIAGWAIGRWIGQLKLFGDQVTTVDNIVTDWFANMIAGWRIFVAHIKVSAISIAQIFNDYLIKPLNTIAKLQGLFIEFRPFEGLAESARKAAVELESARAVWQETGREIGRQRNERGARAGVVPITEELPKIADATTKQVVLTQQLYHIIAENEDILTNSLETALEAQKRLNGRIVVLSREASKQTVTEKTGEDVPDLEGFTE